MTDIEPVFITESGVQYGARIDYKCEKLCYKLVKANNKNTWNWVGVSESEFQLAQKGFPCPTTTATVA